MPGAELSLLLSRSAAAPSSLRPCPGQQCVFSRAACIRPQKRRAPRPRRLQMAWLARWLVCSAGVMLSPCHGLLGLRTSRVLGWKRAPSALNPALLRAMPALQPAFPRTACSAEPSFGNLCEVPFICLTAQPCICLFLTRPCGYRARPGFPRGRTPRGPNPRGERCWEELKVKAMAQWLEGAAGMQGSTRSPEATWVPVLGAMGNVC